MAEQQCVQMAVVMAVVLCARRVLCVAMAAGGGIVRVRAMPPHARNAAGSVVAGRGSCTCNALHGSFGQLWGRAAGGGGAVGGLAVWRCAGPMCT